MWDNRRRRTWRDRHLRFGLRSQLYGYARGDVPWGGRPPLGAIKGSYLAVETELTAAAAERSSPSKSASAGCRSRKSGTHPTGGNRGLLSGSGPTTNGGLPPGVDQRGTHILLDSGYPDRTFNGDHTSGTAAVVPLSVGGLTPRFTQPRRGRVL